MLCGCGRFNATSPPGFFLSSLGGALGFCGSSTTAGGDKNDNDRLCKRSLVRAASAINDVSSSLRVDATAANRSALQLYARINRLGLMLDLIDLIWQPSISSYLFRVTDKTNPKDRMKVLGMARLRAARRVSLL